MDHHKTKIAIEEKRELSQGEVMEINTLVTFMIAFEALLSPCLKVQGGSMLDVYV